MKGGGNMTGALKMRNMSNNSACSCARSRSSMSFGFICAVRFIAYCIFYYFCGSKNNSPKGTCRDTVL